MIYTDLDLVICMPSWFDYFPLFPTLTFEATWVGGCSHSVKPLSHMTMTMTTMDTYKADMKGSSASTTETTTSTVLVVPVVQVVRLEGCMGLAVSDAAVFQRMQSRYVAVMKAVFARAGGMNVDYVEVSIVIDSRRRLVGTSVSRKL